MLWFRLLWNITISLAGEACGYVTELDEKLKDSYENYRLNRPDHSLDLIEDFYEDWRTSFLEEIYRIVSESVPEVKQINVTVNVNDDEYEPVVGAIVEMTTLDGAFESTGNQTNEDGRFQFLLEHSGDEPVFASIYLNGTSRGTFEFSASEETVELVGA